MAEIATAIGAIVNRLATLEPYPADRFHGRGIVVCAGGARMFVNAYVLLRLLRDRLRCALPIQLWHLGPRELSPVMRVRLEELDVELVDARVVQATHPASIADGWQLKPYAILQSRFQEVLLLDADQVPVRDPAEVFEWQQYRENGALFWPDIMDLAAENPAWALCGLEPRSCTSLESGQVVVDKRRHWAALHATMHFNEEADTFYRLVYGDKDTFLLGWLMAQAPYALVPHRPFIDARCLTQRDFDGAPFFQHRTHAKWSYGGPQIQLPNFVHQSACETFAADLRRVWNGRLFFPPERGLAARGLEDTLAGQRMRLIQFGEPDLELEFMPGHQFGAGRGLALQNWYVADAGEKLELVLRDLQQDTYRFVQHPDRQWSGSRLAAPQNEVLLLPAGEAVQQSHGDGLIADLVAASGLSTCSSVEAEAELLAALRLIDRTKPGVADRLRAYAERRSGRNPDLRQSLARIAQRLSTPPPVTRQVLRATEMLERYYRRTWQSS